MKPNGYPKFSKKKWVEFHQCGHDAPIHDFITAEAVKI